MDWQTDAAEMMEQVGMGPPNPFGHGLQGQRLRSGFDQQLTRRFQRGALAVFLT